jgi:hypothetical protein
MSTTRTSLGDLQEFASIPGCSDNNKLGFKQTLDHIEDDRLIVSENYLRTPFVEACRIAVRINNHKPLFTSCKSIRYFEDRHL